eukprot:5043579-Pleurochrysis_carterae.AAC.2
MPSNRLTFTLVFNVDTCRCVVGTYVCKCLEEDDVQQDLQTARATKHSMGVEHAACRCKSGLSDPLLQSREREATTTWGRVCCKKSPAVAPISMLKDARIGHTFKTTSAGSEPRNGPGSAPDTTRLSSMDQP